MKSTRYFIHILVVAALIALPAAAQVRLGGVVGGQGQAQSGNNGLGVGLGSRDGLGMDRNGGMLGSQSNIDAMTRAQMERQREQQQRKEHSAKASRKSQSKPTNVLGGGKSNGGDHDLDNSASGLTAGARNKTKGALPLGKGSNDGDHDLDNQGIGLSAGNQTGASASAGENGGDQDLDNLGATGSAKSSTRAQAKAGDSSVGVETSTKAKAGAKPFESNSGENKQHGLNRAMSRLEANGGASHHSKAEAAIGRNEQRQSQGSSQPSSNSSGKSNSQSQQKAKPSNPHKKGK